MGAGLVIKFMVQILESLLVVLGRASKIKILLCYIRKICSVVEDSSDTPNKKQTILVSTHENDAEVKSVSYFDISADIWCCIFHLRLAGHIDCISKTIADNK